jgi:hypothetical protein
MRRPVTAYNAEYDGSQQGVRSGGSDAGMVR